MSSARIPLNDLGRYISGVSGSLVDCASSVINSGNYVLGRHVASFESAFAEFCVIRHCIGVANGTDALELALRGCGIQPGDAVILCANAGMYGTTAVLAAGATPVFADVDGNGLVTEETISRSLATSAVTPRAVIVTHLYGRLANMNAIMAFARKHQLLVIEDCAQAHGAQASDGRVAGSWGDAAAYSFYPTKNLGALGDAGAVLTNNDEVESQVRQLRQYGWSSKYRSELGGGRNSRLDELQAAFLSRLLALLPGRNTRRQSIASQYGDSISHPDISVPGMAGAAYVAHLYVVRSSRRDALAAHLASAGIASDIHYPVPDHRQATLAERYADVSLPVTEKACAEVLTIPCFPELTDAECAAVIAACNSWGQS